MMGNRRGNLGKRFGAIGIVGLLALTACAPGSQTGEPDPGNATGSGKVVVVSWGAAFTEATRTHLAEPFTAETGIEVQIVDAPGQQVASLQSQSDANDIQWDFFDSLAAADAYVLHDRGLLESLSAELRSELEGVLSEGTVTDFGYSFSALGHIAACRIDVVDPCVSNAEDFFDPDAFPQRRQVVQINPFTMLSIAALAGGVSPDDLATEPLDLDLAFEQMERIKPLVSVWTQSGDQQLQAFLTGEADLGLLWSGRAFSAGDEVPVEVVWSSGVYNPGYMTLVKDGPNPLEAKAFLKWIAENPEAQANWSMATSNSVPNPDAFAFMTEDHRRKLADYPENREKLAALNYQWFVQNVDEVNRRWQEFLGG